MPQSHPTTGLLRFLSPVWLLARKAEWSARKNFTSVLFSLSHQATGPVRFDTGVHLWFDRIISRTPHGSRGMPVRTSYGPRTGISYVFHILRDPHWARADPQMCRMAPLRTRKRIGTTGICKISRTGVVFGHTGPYGAPYGPRKGCSRAVYELQTRTGPVSLH